MITHLGTFDVENYGDLLYPIVLRRLLKLHDPRLQIHHYSPSPGSAPHDAGFETQAILSLFDRSTEPRSLVIGGGDILRTDWDVVASHYDRDSRNSCDQRKHSIRVVSSLNHLLRQAIGRWQHTKSSFRTRWMNYPAAGPFLIDVHDLPPGSLVCYLSCGVPHHFKPRETSRIRHIFDQARFIYLRDEQSAEKLARAGVAGEIRIAPDVTVTLSDQFAKEELARRGRAILSRFGVDDGRPVLCFQCKPNHGFDENEIVRQLDRYQERTGSSVVLLPIGYCHFDHQVLKALARRAGGSLKYAGVDSIFDMMSIIASSELFVGTSLHGNITALSFGIPHLMGPLAVDKTDGFLHIMKLPPELKLSSWSELNNRIDVALGLGRDFFSERAHEAKSKVYRVVNQLLYCLN